MNDYDKLVESESKKLAEWYDAEIEKAIYLSFLDTINLAFSHTTPEVVKIDAE